MTHNLNVNDNLQDRNNIAEVLRKDSGKDMIPVDEEITVMKTEVKEEYCDFEMFTEDMEFVNVKEERTSSPENNFENETLELMKGTERSANENVDSGSCEFKQKNNSAEQKNALRNCRLVKTSTKQPKYKCSNCDYVVERKHNLKQHILIHSNAKPFKCHTCGFVTARKRNLKVHILLKHSEKAKKYKCNVCQYATHVETHLITHSRIHSNEKPFKCAYKNCKCKPEQEGSCKCDTCAYAARHASNLRRHILLNHSKEPKQYMCSVCMYATHIKNLFVQHIRTHDKAFKCTYKNCDCTPEQRESCKCNMCSYATIDKRDLKKHILGRHSDEQKKYKCEHCKYTTHFKGNLMRHSGTHSNDKPFKCTYKNCICIPGQEDFCECDICEYESKTKNDLRVHILVKHSEDQKKYKCIYCKYVTSINANLTRHIGIHSNDKLFKGAYKNCKCTPGQKEFCECNV